MNKSFLAGAIRRHESIKALKEHAQEPLPAFIQGFARTESSVHAQSQGNPSPSNVTTLPCLHQTVDDLEKKKQEHLQLPTQTRWGFMRLSSIFIFLLLLFVAALFFYGGYLYSYMHLPGPGPGIATAQYPGASVPNWRKTQEIIPGTGTLEAAPAGSSYLERRAILQKDQALADDVFTKGEERSKAVAREQAKQVLQTSTAQMTNVVRSLAGNRIASIFDPFATTVVGGTVGQLVDTKTPTTSRTAQADKAKAGTLNASQPTLSTINPQAAATPTKSGQELGAVAGVTAHAAVSPIGSPNQSLPPLFSIEVRTFQDDGAGAWSLMNSLKNKGYTAAYVAREFANNHLNFKVRVGHFTSYLDASRARDALNEPSRIVRVELNENRLIN